MEIVIGFLLGLAISTVVLILAMIIASKLMDGIEFGTFGFVVPRAAGLLLVVNLVLLIPYAGIIIALAVWFFGLMWLFRLEPKEALILMVVNWGLNLVIRLTLLGILVKALS